MKSVYFQEVESYSNIWYNLGLHFCVATQNFGIRAQRERDKVMPYIDNYVKPEVFALLMQNEEKLFEFETRLQVATAQALDIRLPNGKLHLSEVTVCWIPLLRATPNHPSIRIRGEGRYNRKTSRKLTEWETGLYLAVSDMRRSHGGLFPPDITVDVRPVLEHAGFKRA